MLRVIYLIFTEGYAASSGPDLVRADLAEEAIRLARILHRLLPEHREVTGLLALLLLIDARRAARTGPSGELVLLADQDRALWDRGLIEEGRALVVTALRGGAQGPTRCRPRSPGRTFLTRRLASLPGAPARGGRSSAGERDPGGR